VTILKEQLGLDEAFNYKEEIDINSTLQRYFPDGIDIYFDNVRGEMLEAAISNMNLHGRVAICEVISEYTGVGRRAAPDMLNIIFKRLTIKGFVAMDYISLYHEFVSRTIDLIRTGKMHVLEDVSIALESVPPAFVGLFRGYNVGKTIVQVCDN
ncbi:NADP(+)-dependent 2-alkenal reductase-like protein, partial [Tanacetum coccineum]